MSKTLTKTVTALKFLLVILLATICSLYLWINYSTLQPQTVEAVKSYCPEETPVFDNSKPLKVMSYNVQFFASTDYVFYFDEPNDAGPDTAPSNTSVAKTLKEIAQIIIEENPDIVLLQEVHDGAKATYHQDQLAILNQELMNLTEGQKLFPCHASAFYWQADFVPHPKIMGSVGMKLSTLSKYKISSAARYQLPNPPMDWLTTQFHLKRAILDTVLGTNDNQPPLHILNTHFSAFAQGSNTMEKQVKFTQELLSSFDQKQEPWIIGGDFNLLPPNSLNNLQDSQKYLYENDHKLLPLFENWSAIPSLENTQSNTPELWYTHLPNDRDVTTPDRSIDFIFYSQSWKSTPSRVLNTPKMWPISDHFPVIGEFKLAEK